MLKGFQDVDPFLGPDQPSTSTLKELELNEDKRLYHWDVTKTGTGSGERGTGNGSKITSSQRYPS